MAEHYHYARDDRPGDSSRGRERHRRRSRSPYCGPPPTKRKRSSSRSRRDRGRENLHKVKLPLGAKTLEVQDYSSHQGLFSSYLDIQKHLFLEELEEREARGRWKSFVKKWNDGSLAEGWYDPQTSVKAEASFAADEVSSNSKPTGRFASHKDDRQDQRHNAIRRAREDDDGDDDDDDGGGDDYGPSLPPLAAGRHFLQKSTVVAPSMQDIELRREEAEEEQEAARIDLRHERRAYRKEEQSRQDELAPRADPGTRERQMEKRREVAASNKAFAESKTEGGAAMEVKDDDLMGGDDGMDEYKRRKQDMEKKKSERDLRREEILRARQEERLERIRAYRDKEDKTMAGLIALAKQKYG